MCLALAIAYPGPYDDDAQTADLRKLERELERLMMESHSDVVFPRIIRYINGDMPHVSKLQAYGIRTDLPSYIIDSRIMTLKKLRYVPISENPRWIEDTLGPVKCNIEHKCPCFTGGAAEPKIWFHSECLRGTHNVNIVPTGQKLVSDCSMCRQELQTTTLNDKGE